VPATYILLEAGGCQNGKKSCTKLPPRWPKHWAWIKNTKINLKTVKKRPQKQRGEVKMTKLRLKTTKFAKNHTFKNREILSNIHLF
jgi:hypothetical protein